MEILMFVGTAYAVLYVMWLLVIVVSGVAERWVNVTLFFVFAPFFLVFCATMALLGVIVSPFVFYFSAKARQEFREKLFEPVLKENDMVYAVHTAGYGEVFSVAQELEYEVKTHCGEILVKTVWDFYRIGEKIEFN